MSFMTGFQKAADVSKEELRTELKKHEERETPEQEAAESPKEQEVERRAGVEKKAFFGFGKKDHAKGHQEAHQGFDDNAEVYALEGTPIPHETLGKWKSEMTPEKHHKWHHGQNHFADKFNDWLDSEEGEKWNDEQAAKHRAGVEKGASVASHTVGPVVNKATSFSRWLKRKQEGEHEKEAGLGLTSAIGAGIGAIGNVARGAGPNGERGGVVSRALKGAVAGGGAAAVGHGAAGLMMKRAPAMAGAVAKAAPQIHTGPLPAGIKKVGFFAGFEKEAQVFSIKHKDIAMAAGKLRNLASKAKK